jgi:cytochrome P450
MTTAALEIFAALDSPAGRADPYPHYAALHELGEAVRLAPGSVALVGYDTIAAVLRDPAVRHHDYAQIAEVIPEWLRHPSVNESRDWILNLDPPEHTRIRSLMSRAFTARRVAALEPAIARIADDLLDGLAERGSGGAPVEFMHDFAYLLPVTVICELIGIPRPIGPSSARWPERSPRSSTSRTSPSWLMPIRPPSSCSSISGSWRRSGAPIRATTCSVPWSAWPTPATGG